MKTVDMQNAANEMKTDLQILLGQNTPKELEESLFQIFEEAYLFGEPDLEERTRRALLHYTLRKMLRHFQENPEILKTLFL